MTMKAKSERTKDWPLLAACVFVSLAFITHAHAQQGTPTIVSTSPRVGDTSVDPALKEVTVTFDRDMAGGFSWTGGGPEYPSTPPGQRVVWRDKRTCVLPVKLEPMRHYRVGINSVSYQNFRSAAGVPARPSAIYFTTRGAGPPPLVIDLNPPNGAKDVSAELTEVRVTFSLPMGAGFSWCGDGPTHPDSPEGKQPYWTADRKTCVLPVSLNPGRTYEIGLNCPSYKNFRSAGGLPLEPVTYTFTTKK